jgi:hypothetical protein
VKRIPTNFGNYEIEYRSRVPRVGRGLRSMMHLIAAALAVVLAGLFLFPLNAHAGRSCEEHRPNAATIIKGLELAQRTAQQLDASGAQVVLLARAGQDLGKYGLRYSHMGLAYKTEAGAWRVVHKLNQCNTATAGGLPSGAGRVLPR